MEFLFFIFEYGIGISIAAFVLFLALLIVAIRGLVRSVREAQLFSVPLIEKQDIEFMRAGTVILAMEGPLFSRRFAKLKYEIKGPDGMEANSRPTLFRMSTAGFAKARMELKVFKIKQPGRYEFRIHGLGGKKQSDAEHCMVFLRPHLACSIIYIIGIVISAMFTAGSIVLFGFRLTSNN